LRKLKSLEADQPDYALFSSFRPREVRSFEPPHEMGGREGRGPGLQGIAGTVQGHGDRHGPARVKKQQA